MKYIKALWIDIRYFLHWSKYMPIAWFEEYEEAKRKDK